MPDILYNPSDTRHLLKQLRKKKHWTQEELAEKLNVAAGTIKNWERGKAQPTPYNLRQLLQILEENEINLELAGLPDQSSNNDRETTIAPTPTNPSSDPSQNRHRRRDLSQLTRQAKLKWILTVTLSTCLIISTFIIGWLNTHQNSYIYSFPNGDRQGWVAFGPAVTYGGTKDIDANGDNGSFSVRTHLSTINGQDTTEAAVYFKPVNLSGKTASCKILIATPIPLTANPNDRFYFRLLVRSPGGQTGHREYGGKSAGGFQSGQWFSIQMVIGSSSSDPDNDPQFLASQVDALEVLLKVDVGAHSQIQDNPFDFYIDDCKIV